MASRLKVNYSDNREYATFGTVKEVAIWNSADKRRCVEAKIPLSRLAFSRDQSQHASHILLPRTILQPTQLISTPQHSQKHGHNIKRTTSRLDPILRGRRTPSRPREWNSVWYNLWSLPARSGYLSTHCIYGNCRCSNHATVSRSWPAFCRCSSWRFAYCAHACWWQGDGRREVFGEGEEVILVWSVCERWGWGSWAWDSCEGYYWCCEIGRWGSEEIASSGGLIDWISWSCSNDTQNDLAPYWGLVAMFSMSAWMNRMYSIISNDFYVHRIYRYL